MFFFDLRRAISPHSLKNEIAHIFASSLLLLVEL